AAFLGLNRNRILLREVFQRRIHVVRQRLEQREERQRRDKATRKDDLQSADLVGKRAEDDEERRAQQQRDRDQRVRGHAVHAKCDREEEQRVELPGVPDHALARRGAKQRQQHILVVRVAQEAVGQRRL